MIFAARLALVPLAAHNLLRRNRRRTCLADGGGGDRRLQHGDGGAVRDHAHRRSLDEALRNPGRVDFFWVRCARVDATGRVAAAIDEMFRNSRAETESRTEKAFMTDLLSRFKPITAMVEGIGFAIAPKGFRLDRHRCARPDFRPDG